MYQNPFVFDPFAYVYQAFKNLYPGKECKCLFSDNLTDDNGEKVFGITEFQDDGSVIVLISLNLSIVDAIEVLAHELAHVAMGVEEEHGQKWKDCFDAIYDEYDKITSEDFGE